MKQLNSREGRFDHEFKLLVNEAEGVPKLGEQDVAKEELIDRRGKGNGRLLHFILKMKK